jgi:hypothetical protein
MQTESKLIRFLKCMELQVPEKQTSVCVSLKVIFTNKRVFKKIVSKYKSKINKMTKCREFL